MKRAILTMTLSMTCAAQLAAAQTPYPAQTLRAVVGYAAGGGADGVIRAMVNELSEALGQPVVIDNRPGGGTVIATQLVAASKPDGYTFLMMDTAFIVNPALRGKLPYDSVRDFAPVIAAESSSTSMLVVHPSVPVHSVKEFLALARANAGKLNYASGGNGTVPHILGEMLKYTAKINLTHVPYKSTGLAIYAVTSGEVPVAMGGIFAVKSLADAGKLRALAIAAKQRNGLMPQIPTFIETGWPTIDATGYRGFLMPAGAPREAISRLNAAANKALQASAVRTRLTDAGYVPLGGTPEEFARIVRGEMDKWGTIIRNAGIKVE